MEYYLVEKHIEILKAEGKWIKLEESILSKVTQSQKDNHGKNSLIYGFCIWEQRITSLQFILPEKLANKEDPTRDIQVTLEKGKETRSHELFGSMGEGRGS